MVTFLFKLLDLLYSSAGGLSIGGHGLFVRYSYF
jgi:hypothetical protein